MGQPVVHFEIIGKDPAKLRDYFGELFGWEFDVPSPFPRQCPTRLSTASSTA